MIKNSNLHEESTFKGFDGTELFYQVWGQKKPKATLVFVHGLNEYSGRYQNPIQYFHSKGYTLYLYDHRGHGKSDGVKSFAHEFSDFEKDLDIFVKLVSEREMGKKFLIAHSLGGQIALNYLGHFSNKLSGFVTSSPNIEVGFRVWAIEKWIAGLIGKISPKISLPNNVSPRYISRDREVVKAYVNDPYVRKTITVNLAQEILKNQETIHDLAPKINLPALMLHAGADKICSPHGSKKFFENLASKDKDLKIYEGFYHEIFNEIGKEQVFRDMEDWLEKHL